MAGLFCALDMYEKQENLLTQTVGFHGKPWCRIAFSTG